MMNKASSGGCVGRIDEWLHYQVSSELTLCGVWVERCVACCPMLEV